MILALLTSYYVATAPTPNLPVVPSSTVLLSAGTTNATLQFTFDGYFIQSNSIVGNVTGQNYSVAAGQLGQTYQCNYSGTGLVYSNGLFNYVGQGGGVAQVIFKSNGVAYAGVNSLGVGPVTNGSSVNQQILYATNNGYTAGDLVSGMFQELNPLLTNSSRVLAYSPFTCDLATNHNVWTWPLNLSCVAITDAGYQVVLVSSNECTSQYHYQGLSPGTVTCRGSDGVLYTSAFTNVIVVYGDGEICQLQTPMPAVVTPAQMFLPNWTNYIGASILNGSAKYNMQGIPAIWPHKNTARVEFACFNANSGFGVNYIFNNFISEYSPAGVAATIGTGGDSGAPQFTVVGTNVVLMTTSTSAVPGYSYTGGILWNDPNVFSNMVSLGLTNGMKFVDLSGYTTY